MRIRRALLLLAIAVPVVGIAADPVRAFLDDHWGGVPTVGEPTGWGPLESSMLPKDCGVCHPQQLADWSQSRHSMAMSPGVLGQLLDNPDGNDVCNKCHAPLAEQRPVHGKAAFREDLRATGMSCPACHVRDGQMHGPPRREGRPAPTSDYPHRGYTESAAYQDGQFCGTCHQFTENQGRADGVLIENTWNEWKASEWGARGEQCQSCHMPDRRHLWRGIHDPAFTEAALAIDLVRGEGQSATYTLTSVKVGHSFPTYVTPRVTLVVVGKNADGKAVVRQSHVIQRRLDLSLNQESDTRLNPGQSASVTLTWSDDDGVVTVEALTMVEPDEFYHRFFLAYTAKTEAAAPLIEQAKVDTKQSVYSIGERTLSVK